MTNKTNKTLFELAIADAKQIKEVALKTARMSMLDAFEPKLQAMFSEKIKAEVEGDEEDDNIEIEDEPITTTNEEEETEGDGEEVQSTADDDQTVKEEDEIDTEEPVVSEEDDEDIDIDIEDDDEAPVTEEDEEKTDDEKELEEILKELEGDTETEEDEPKSEDDITMENEDNDEDDAIVDTDPVTEEDEASMETPVEEPKSEDDEDINIDELVADMKEEDEANDETANYELEEQKRKTARLSKELSEAVKTIKSLRNTMNEVNLLNSKLLYANKIFRQYEKLSEAQKVKVIDNMDKANSLREVKLVYVTLVESLKSTDIKKAVNGSTKRLTESIASGVTGSTRLDKKQVILESNDIKDRFQKLANINQKNNK